MRRLKWLSYPRSRKKSLPCLSQTKITFANQTANEILDLTEDEDGAIQHPAWKVRDPRGEEHSDMRALTHHVGVRQRIAVEWSTGWTVLLMVHTDYVSAEAGEAGGIVATFERPAEKG